MVFIINTLTRWDEPPRARHQFAKALSKKHNVYFVSANCFGWPKINEIKEDENFRFKLPFFPIPFKVRYRLPFINEFYQKWLFNKLSKEFSDCTVVNFDYTSRLIFRYFKNVVYYCNDNFFAISSRLNPKFVVKYHRKCEEFISKNATFCIATTSILKEKLKKITENVFEIQLGGVDISNYNLIANTFTNKNNIINIGLIGFIRNYNLSYQLINRLLAHPKINLTLIGPTEKKFLNNLINQEKVRILGVLTGRELFDEVNNFDVAIAPYNSSKLKEGGAPNKLWIYLALGKPVVVSDLVSLRTMNFPEKTVYISKSKEDFLELSLKAVEENNKDLIKKRILFSKNNSWDKRVEQFLEIYNNFFD